MKSWNGSIKDTTNFKTDKYLKINNCGFQNMPSGYTVFRESGRSDYHILLVTSGMCEVLYGGEMHSLEQGNFIVYLPYEEQRYTSVTESTSMWCHFDGSIAEELLKSCNIYGGVYKVKPERAVYNAYTAVIQRFHQKGKENFANASLLELMYCISNLPSDFVAEKEDVILPALTYINANYNKKITPDKLAKITGYSVSRFLHLFSEVTGTTPIKYQNEIRLKISCEMLMSTNYTVTEIAFDCGFNDPLYYSRIFKRKYNMSPTEYRQKN